MARRVFAIDRVKALAPDHPEWATTAPYDAILSDDQKAMEAFTEQDWEQIIGATHAGMTVEEFKQVAAEWAATAKNPKFDRLYTQCVYQPMLEVLNLLRDERLPHLHRLRRRAGLHPLLRGGCLRHPAGAGHRHHLRDRLWLWGRRRADADQGRQAPAQ